MRKIIFHIDVNSAYLSWTAVEELKNGGRVDLRADIRRSSAGIRSPVTGLSLQSLRRQKSTGSGRGNRLLNAFRKCPNLIMRAPDHKMYHEKSRRLMEYLRSFTEEIEQVSVDECYMDFTEIADRFHVSAGGS